MYDEVWGDDESLGEEIKLPGTISLGRHGASVLAAAAVSSRAATLACNNTTRRAQYRAPLPAFYMHIVLFYAASSFLLISTNAELNWVGTGRRHS